MKVSIKSFEKYGFKLVLESEIKKGKPNEFTLNKPIQRTDWLDCLVWNKVTNQLTASSHNLFINTPHFRIERTFQEVINTEEELEVLLKKHNLIT